MRFSKENKKKSCVSCYWKCTEYTIEGGDKKFFVRKGHTRMRHDIKKKDVSCDTG